MKNLVIHSINLLQKSKHLYSCSTTLLFSQCLLPILMSELVIRISNNEADHYNLIIYYFLIEIITHLTNKIYQTLILNRAIINVDKLFQLEAYAKYSSLSYDCMRRNNIMTFNKKKNGAQRAITTFITWGLETIVRLVGSVISCILTFTKSNVIIYLVPFIVINILFYFAHTKNKQIEYADLRSKTKKNSENISSRLQLLLPLFKNGKITTDTIASLANEDEKIWMPVREIWGNITYSTKSMNSISIMIICLTVSKENIILLMMQLALFQSAIGSFMEFFNVFNNSILEYEIYHSFWEDQEYKTKLEQCVIPEILTITNINVDRGNFKLCAQNLPFDIVKGDKILVRGPTGHGKSTFLNALLGKIDGLWLLNMNTNVSPMSFVDDYVEFYQSITSDMPFSNISIRDLFYSEMDDSKINSALEICFPYDLKDILENLRTNKSKNKSDCANNSFDIHINEIFSGGQCSRLCLAIQVYNMMEHGKSCLILDEMEQGSDPKTAVKVLDNIMKIFSDKTIIVVSHLCKCQINKIEWTKRIKVKNGVIYFGK